MKTRAMILFFGVALFAAAAPGCADSDEGREPSREPAPSTEGVADDAGLEPMHGGCTYECSTTGKSFFPRSACEANCAGGTCTVDVC